MNQVLIFIIAFCALYEVSTFKILKSLKELVAAEVTSVASLQDAVLLVVPLLMLVIASFSAYTTK
jgi:hypothetical protein